ncbi:hypothetical protein [Kitasatospora sp. NPDC058218]|uniref:hypothetical protein n=1 Tax=Kitasatospora sp. NPDC058218 TaxID=3346385 RepID=UPI0036D9A45D
MAELHALLGQGTQDEGVVTDDPGLDRQRVRLVVVALGEALFAGVVRLPAGQVHSDGCGGEHLSTVLVGAEGAPTQAGHLGSQVLDQGGSAVLAAVAFVDLGEHADHVADCGDLGGPGDGAASNGCCALRALVDIRQRQVHRGDGVRRGGEELSTVQISPPHPCEDAHRVGADGQPKARIGFFHRP